MTEAPEPPLLEFLEVMRRLRAECPWKAEQTHRSLSRYLLEETHETLEAIDTGDSTGDWSHLCEELGDLLLQVYFHAVIAEERGAFTIDDVAGDVTAKMHRRNPHVFGDPGTDRPATAAEVSEAWERIKAQEKKQTPTTLPDTLPALLYATKALERGAVAPEAAGEGDLGARLLALVAEAVEAGVDPEQALRDAVRGSLPGPGDVRR
jgi:XTP/dITP diphosphohydrolase